MQINTTLTLWLDLPNDPKNLLEYKCDKYLNAPTQKFPGVEFLILCIIKEMWKQRDRKTGGYHAYISLLASFTPH